MERVLFNHVVCEPGKERRGDKDVAHIRHCPDAFSSLLVEDQQCENGIASKTKIVCSNGDINVNRSLLTFFSSLCRDHFMNLDHTKKSTIHMLDYNIEDVKCAISCLYSGFACLPKERGNFIQEIFEVLIIDQEFSFTEASEDELTSVASLSCKTNKTNSSVKSPIVVSSPNVSVIPVNVQQSEIGASVQLNFNDVNEIPSNSNLSNSQNVLENIKKPIFLEVLKSPEMKKRLKATYEKFKENSGSERNKCLSDEPIISKLKKLSAKLYIPDRTNENINNSTNGNLQEIPNSNLSNAKEPDEEIYTTKVGSNSKTKYKCFICKKTFKNIMSLRSHLNWRSTFNKITCGSNLESKFVLKTQVCKVCDTFFPEFTPYGFIRHVQKCLTDFKRKAKEVKLKGCCIRLKPIPQDEVKFYRATLMNGVGPVERSENESNKPNGKSTKNPAAENSTQNSKIGKPTPKRFKKSSNVSLNLSQPLPTSSENVSENHSIEKTTEVNQKQSKSIQQDQIRPVLLAKKRGRPKKIQPTEPNHEPVEKNLPVNEDNKVPKNVINAEKTSSPKLPKVTKNLLKIKKKRGRPRKVQPYQSLTLIRKIKQKSNAKKSPEIPSTSASFNSTLKIQDLDVNKKPRGRPKGIKIKVIRPNDSPNKKSQKISKDTFKCLKAYSNAYEPKSDFMVIRNPTSGNSVTILSQDQDPLAISESESSLKESRETNSNPRKPLAVRGRLKLKAITDDALNAAMDLMENPIIPVKENSNVSLNEKSNIPPVPVSEEMAENPEIGQFESQEFAQENNEDYIIEELLIKSDESEIETELKEENETENSEEFADFISPLITNVESRIPTVEESLDDVSSDSFETQIVNEESSDLVIKSVLSLSPLAQNEDPLNINTVNETNVNETAGNIQNAGNLNSEINLPTTSTTKSFMTEIISSPNVEKEQSTDIIEVYANIKKPDVQNKEKFFFGKTKINKVDAMLTTLRKLKPINLTPSEIPFVLAEEQKNLLRKVRDIAQTRKIAPSVSAEKSNQINNGNEVKTSPNEKQQISTRKKEENSLEGFNLMSALNSLRPIQNYLSTIPVDSPSQVSLSSSSERTDNMPFANFSNSNPKLVSFKETGSEEENGTFHCQECDQYYNSKDSLRLHFCPCI